MKESTQKDEANIKDIMTENSRRGFLSTLGTAGIVGLAGCTGGETSSSPSNESGTSTSTSGGSGSTLTANIPQRIGTIDPAKGSDYVQGMMLVNLYDPLVFPDPEGVMQPHLATDWEVSDDNLTYTFTLRDDATFHSGNQVTAEDVKFSIERFLDLEQGFSSLLSDVVAKDNISVEDEQTVSFELTRPYAPFLATMALGFIVDKELIMNNLANGEYGERGDYGQEFINNQDAGSGSYMVSDFTRGSGITFSKFDDHFLEFPDGSFDTVEIRIITENSTVRTMMANGELDMTSQYQNSNTYSAIDSMDHARVEKVPTFGLLYNKINTQREPTDDPAVREALAWGFDYEQVVNEIRPDMQMAKGPIPPTWPAHKEDVLQPTYDPERARRVLDEAGYSEGEITITNTFTSSYAFQERIALLFKENMADIGINVELNPQTWGTITDLATSPESTPHTTQVFYTPAFPSPDSMFYSQYHSAPANTFMNMEHLNDDQVDSLIEEARSTADREERMEIYRELQSVIANLYCDMHLYHTVKTIGFQNDVEGFRLRPAVGFEYAFRDLHRTE